MKTTQCPKSYNVETLMRWLDLGDLHFHHAIVPIASLECEILISYVGLGGIICCGVYQSSLAAGAWSRGVSRCPLLGDNALRCGGVERKASSSKMSCIPPRTDPALFRNGLPVTTDQEGPL